MFQFTQHKTSLESNSTLIVQVMLILCLNLNMMRVTGTLTASKSAFQIQNPKAEYISGNSLLLHLRWEENC